MQTKQQLSNARKIAIGGLLIFSLAVVWQKILGVTNYPPVPPAIIISIVAACLYFFVHKRWAAIVAFLIPLSLVVGMFITQWHLQLLNPSVTGYPGIVLQWIAAVIVMVAGVWAIVEEYRSNK